MHSERHAQGFPLVTESSCAAVVSAYRPSRVLVENVRRLLDQFAVVIVVDDGSDDDGAVVDACAELGAQVMRQVHNRGIGHALNRGVDQVRAHHPDVTIVMTFDQDSVPPPHLLQSYESAARSAEEQGLRVGSISPGVVGGARVRSRRDADLHGVVDEPIQSGLCVPLWLIDALGGFDETFFIDGVDTDFHWRLVDSKHVSIAALRVGLEHDLGSREPGRFLNRTVSLAGRPVMIMQSAPFRYHYITRNRVILLRRYLTTHPLPMLRGLILDARHLAVVAVLGSRRRERLGHALSGVRAGLRGETGRLPDDRPTTVPMKRTKGSSHE